MAISRSFRALELYDVLGNLVPGAVFLFGISAVFQIESYVQFSNGTIAAAVFLVGSLVSGHMVQAFASELNGTPTLFGEVVQATRDGDTEGLPIEISHIEDSIWPLMKNKFQLPDEFNDYGALFRLLLSYIETTPATRALRFQALHTFHRSMWGVGFLVTGLVLVGMVSKCIGLIDVRSWQALALVFVISIAGIWVFDNRKEHFNELFIKYAIVDFYTDQIERVQKPRTHQRSS